MLAVHSEHPPAQRESVRVGALRDDDRRIVLVWRADYVPPAARAFIELVMPLSSV